MGLEKNLRSVLDQIDAAAEQVGRKGEDIKLVAVSKGHTIEEMREAYFLGIRDFGESRVNEALEKMERLPSDIRWHFIGKLQKNKVSKVIGRFTLIHSVDSLELAERISLLSMREGLQTAILLEVNTSGEATKSGLSFEGWREVYSKLLDLNGVSLEGLMTMAPLTEDEATIRHCFSELKHCAEKLGERGGNLTTLSMGMSNDFPLAIQEGATLVRIGTALFITQ